MFEQSPFEGACNYAVWEVIVMLGGTLALGVLLGYLIWGWTKKKLLLAQQRIVELEKVTTAQAIELRDQKSIGKAKASQAAAARILVENLKASGAEEPTAAEPPKPPVALAEHWEMYPAELDMPAEVPPSTEKLEAASKIMGRDVRFNDLTIVEGIGPAIAEVLGRSGIKSWAQLAGTTKHILRVVLDEAGPQYRVHKPKTWPRQAQMASKGEWKKLKAYQDVLIGGK